MARARTTDVETSHEAAASVSESDSALILRDLVAVFGAIGFALATAVEFRVGSTPERRISDSGVRSRISELREAGYVEWQLDRNGEQMYHYPSSGRRHRLQRVTQKGLNCVIEGETPVIRGSA